MSLYDEPVMTTANARKPSQAGRKTRSPLSARRTRSRSPGIAGQEDFFQSWRAADERIHPPGHELLQDTLQLPRRDAPAAAVPVEGLRLDRRAREVAEVGERAALHRLAVADDAHAIAQRLDFGEDVAGEQHRAPVLALVAHAPA